MLALGESKHISQATDTELVEAAQRGDLASFGQLFERHYRMAVGIARSRITDLHLAEEVAQEAFSIACRTLSSLRNGERFPQWLGTICRRTASRVSQSQSKHESLSNEEKCPDAVDHAILQRDMREALAVLDETSRELVLLHYFSGLSHNEIALVVELTPQAVHGRLQRARAKLAEILAPDETAAESAVGSVKPRKKQ